MSKQVEKSKSLSLSVSKHVWVAEKSHREAACAR